MRQPLVVAGLGALASALLHLSFATGGGLPLFAYFVQLPLAFTGLALGATSAALAALAAGTLVLVAGSWIAALVFLLVQAAPGVLLAHFVLLWRQDGDGRTEWYPIGRAVGHLTLYVLAVTAIGLVAAELLTGDLEGLLAGSLRSTLAVLAGTVPPADAAAPAWLHLLPGFVAASWILMSCINALLAQRLAERSGMARRPTPAMAEFAAPGHARWLVAGGGLVALFADGLLLHLAATVAIGALLLYLLQGLAVVHALFAWRGWPRAALVPFYLVLLVFAWPLVLPLVALGLAEDVTRLRDRMI